MKNLTLKAKIVNKLNLITLTIESAASRVLRKAAATDRLHRHSLTPDSHYSAMAVKQSCEL